MLVWFPKDSVSVFHIKRGYAVNLIMVVQNKKTRDAIVDALRIRISPWKLLYESLRNEVLGSELSQDVLRSLLSSP